MRHSVLLALLLQSLQLLEKTEAPSVYSEFQLPERRCDGLCIMVESYHALRCLGRGQDDWLASVTDQNNLVAQNCRQSVLVGLRRSLAHFSMGSLCEMS